MNWTKILVPHDFSASANHAAALARDEAKAHGGSIVLLHVIDLPLQLMPDAVIVTAPGGMQMSVRDLATTGAEQHLADLERRLTADGIAVSHAIRVGKPVDEILRFATDEQVGIIVMGTHGHGGIRAFVAGSVTERVIRNATVPVLSVRHPD